MEGAHVGRREDNALYRSSFLDGFVFGTGSSAYQYEGSTNVDGRAPCNWDTWVRTPGKIKDGSDADIAVDQYNRFKEDVKLMKDLGTDAYHFSISWSRLFPDEQVNPAGVAYYNALIDELLKNGIKPCVTIYHWDHPQALEDSPINGWLGEEMVNKFLNYANVCFDTFGDRVKHWITINEMHSIVTCSYAYGVFPPGVKDSPTMPYIAGHNLLLAHAAAVNSYKTKYQANQRGEIGIAVCSTWSEPRFDSPLDVKAARRSLDFELGWFLDPVVYGDYPASMRRNVGDRLPKFTKEESDSLRGSYDFIGLNYLTGKYVMEPQPGAEFKEGLLKDMNVSMTYETGGILIGPIDPALDKSDPETWDPIYGALCSVPWGLYKLLNYIHKNYKSPVIYITENGANQVGAPLHASLNDDWRIKFHLTHLGNLHNAIRDGVDVRGYFVWSLLDGWEWLYGYTPRFGLFYVEHSDRSRHEKKSAKWFREFLHN